MDAPQVADIEGILVSLGLVFVLLVGLAATTPALRARAIGPFAGSGTLLAAGVAVLATTGSLWFSEGAHFPPCELCWYQRIAMYPLVVVLGIAGLRGDRSGRATGLVLAGGGLAVSLWHNVEETFPGLDTGSCDPANPCTIRWVEGLGFWTIPRMAAVCFALIITLVLVDHLSPRSHPEPTL